MSLNKTFPTVIEEIIKRRPHDPVFNEICNDFEELSELLARTVGDQEQVAIDLRRDALESLDDLKVEIERLLQRS